MDTWGHPLETPCKAKSGGNAENYSAVVRLMNFFIKYIRFVVNEYAIIKYQSLD